MSTPTAEDQEQQDNTPPPFIFIATNTVRDGMLAEERLRAPGWATFIRTHEPRLLAFHEDIANPVVRLLSDESKYVTGQTFPIDGGVCAQ